MVKSPNSELNSKLHLYDTAFLVAVFFMSGIMAASFGLKGLVIIIATLLLAATFYAFKRNIVFALLVFIIPFGAFYYNFYKVAHRPIVPLDKNAVLTGVVNAKPQEGATSQALELDLRPPYRGTIDVYLPNLPRFQYGDLIKFSGKVEKGAYAGALPSLYVPSAELMKSGEGSAFQSFLFKIKDSLSANIDRILPAEKSALAKGIIFGERADFTKEFTAALKNSGTTHIVALSGYNVSIIGLVMTGICSFFWGRRRAFWITIIFIVLFIMMTGAQASSVRAAVMAVVLLVAERQSRLYSFRNAITLAAALMLLFDPTLLIFNAGFELSFAALIGIVVFGPYLQRFLKADRNSGFMDWRKNLAETTAAQIATIPISMIVFSSFAPWAPLSNLLILSFVPATMFFGFLAALLGFVSGGLSLAVGWIANMLLGYEIFIINLFGAHLS